MADINVEKKSGAVWPWIVGLVVLGLLIWALSGAFGGEDEAEMAAVDPVATEVQPTMPPTEEPESAGIPVSEIVESPTAWTGQTVGGEVRVVEVPTDRGFWIEDGGERLFVILHDAPAERPVDVSPGQTIRLNGAVIHDDITNVPGELDAATRGIAQDLPVFLGVGEPGLEILQTVSI